MDYNKIPLVRVQSSNIAAVGYHFNTATLVVSFVSGGKYVYADVPQSVADGFFTPAKTESAGGDISYSTRSVGRYFNNQVRGKFDTTKVEPAQG